MQSGWTLLTIWHSGDGYKSLDLDARRKEGGVRDTAPEELFVKRIEACDVDRRGTAVVNYFLQIYWAG